MPQTKVQAPDVVAVIESMRCELAEKIDHTNLRLSTIEALQALAQSETILTELAEACGTSEVRARIMECCIAPVTRAALLEQLGMTQQHLSNETKPLRERRLLHQYVEAGQMYYVWAPQLSYLHKARVKTALRRNQANGQKKVTK